MLNKRLGYLCSSFRSIALSLYIRSHFYIGTSSLTTFWWVLEGVQIRYTSSTLVWQRSTETQIISIFHIGWL